jgi:hypothetical protein
MVSFKAYLILIRGSPRIISFEGDSETELLAATSTSMGYE